ncbi:MAG: ABC transporter permease subunit [Anaerolineales bacterium]|nr:ABC transporter permease subunit [Anaerolineales bacterium]
MIAIFSNTLSRYRGSILGWGIVLGLYSVILVGLYNSVLEMRPTLQAALENYPPELIAFIGDIPSLFTPSGFLNTYVFSYMALFLGIFAVLTGSGILAGDEESGILDLLISHPITRTRLFWGRSLGFIAATALILAIMWMGSVLAAPRTAMEVTFGQLASPHVSIFALLLLFGAMTTFLSMVLPSRKLAASAAGLILVASFMATMIVKVNPDLEVLNKISPFGYYQGGFAIDGLNWTWVAGLLASALIFELGAWLLFLRRDIRIAGERGWQIPQIRFWWKSRNQEPKAV